MHAIQRILVPFDFSPHSQAALRTATDLANQLGGGTLHLLHVLVPPAYMYSTEIYTGGIVEGVLESTERNLEKVAASIADIPGRVETHVVAGGLIAETIDRVAERLEVDLIVMGTHGRTGISHALLGSVAERALRKAPCPVLTVRSTAETVHVTDESSVAHETVSAPASA